MASNDNVSPASPASSIRRLLILQILEKDEKPRRPKLPVARETLLLLLAGSAIIGALSLMLRLLL